MRASVARYSVVARLATLYQSGQASQARNQVRPQIPARLRTVHQAYPQWIWQDVRSYVRGALPAGENSNVRRALR